MHKQFCLILSLIPSLFKKCFMMLRLGNTVVKLYLKSKTSKVYVAKLEK